MDANTEAERLLASIQSDVARLKEIMVRSHLLARAGETVTHLNVATHDGSAKGDGYDEPPSRCIP